MTTAAAAPTTAKPSASWGVALPLMPRRKRSNAAPGPELPGVHLFTQCQPESRRFAGIRAQIQALCPIESGAGQYRNRSSALTAKET